MTAKFLYSSIIAVFILCSCNEKEEPFLTPNIDVSKQWILDNIGVVISSPFDGQWQTKTFTSQELDLFNSLDTTNLNGTTSPLSVVETSPGYNSIFPNPFMGEHALALRFNTGFSGQIVIKAVVVDSTMTPYSKVSARLNVENASTILAFAPTIPVGRFRLYYTLSSQANPHFYKSWGNIQKTH